MCTDIYHRFKNSSENYSPLPPIVSLSVNLPRLTDIWPFFSVGRGTSMQILNYRITIYFASIMTFMLQTTHSSHRRHNDRQIVPRFSRSDDRTKFTRHKQKKNSIPTTSLSRLFEYRNILSINYAPQTECTISHYFSGSDSVAPQDNSQRHDPWWMREAIRVAHKIFKLTYFPIITKLKLYENSYVNANNE